MILPPGIPGSNFADAADFAGGVLPTGTITFNPGVTTQTITALVQGDVAVEADEGFTVTLSNPNPGNVQIAQATAAGTIVNDDESYDIATQASTNGVGGSFNLEGTGGVTPFTFIVGRTGYAGDAALLNWTVALTGTGTGSADVNDFGGNLPSGQIFFSAGETAKPLAVFVTGDFLPESNETFNVTLSSANPGQVNVTIATTVGTSATATGEIENDDTAFSVSPLNVSQSEGNSGTTLFTFTVTRTGTSPDANSNNGGVPVALPATTVNWAVTGSGANPANAQDFVNGVLPGGTLFFADNNPQTIAVPVQGDTLVELDEGFTVTLSGPSNGGIITTPTADGTILNDESRRVDRGDRRGEVRGKLRHHAVHLHRHSRGRPQRHDFGELCGHRRRRQSRGGRAGLRQLAPFGPGHLRRRRYVEDDHRPRHRRQHRRAGRTVRGDAEQPAPTPSRSRGFRLSARS